MIRSEARIPTSSADRYAKRLCNHAAHMVDHVEWTPPYGLIGFPWVGTCRIEAGPDELVLVAEAATPEGLSRIREIVGGDLERFARRNSLKVNWSS